VARCNGQDNDTLNGKRVQGGTGPDDIGNCIIRPDFVEMGMGSVNFFFGSIDPLKDPSCHCQRGCRYIPCCPVKACEHLSECPVGRC
jgi:hypothetical protein